MDGGVGGGVVGLIMAGRGGGGGGEGMGDGGEDVGDVDVHYCCWRWMGVVLRWLVGGIASRGRWPGKSVVGLQAGVFDE